MTPRRQALALVALLVVATGAGGAIWWSGRDDPAARRAAVAERGAGVMPFDLDATTHRFRTTDEGGVQEVVADDPADTEQVELVRGHLRDEAERFAAGDFDDPAAIHGDDMPGLAALRAGAVEVDVEVADLPAGGRITYTAVDPALVAAIHDWFDAQVSDHGAHAEHAP